VYDLLITHSQNNHFILKEAEPLIGEVDEFSFKYYKFEWPIEDPDAESITFEILPIHGDSDIYVSREDIFPNKTHYEKRSMKVGNAEDHVEFKATPENSLVATYYIGVYGYSYSTYGLLVRVQRSYETLEDVVQ